MLCELVRVNWVTRMKGVSVVRFSYALENGSSHRITLIVLCAASVLNANPERSAAEKPMTRKLLL
jgi:hypothetical protein